MKKIYSLVLLLLAVVLFAPAALAETITLKTPDPTLVKVEYREYYGGTGTYLDWTSGDLTHTFERGQVIIYPIDGYQFVAASGKQNDAKWPKWSDLPQEGVEQEISYYSVDDGDVFYFEVEKYTPKQITLKVDDYTHISVSSNREAVELTANETVITKGKGTYAQLMLTAGDEYLLKSVKVGGTEKLSDTNGVEEWSTYWDDLEKNTTVDVTTIDRPAKSVNIAANPDNIVVKYLDEEIAATDVNGVKTFVVPNVAKNKSVEIFAKDGYALEHLVKAGRDDEEYIMPGAVYTNINEYGLSYGVSNFSIEAYNKEDRRDAKFKITIDRPELLYFARKGDFLAMTNNNTNYLTPEAGVETEYGINLENENPIDIRPRDASKKKIYRVLQRAKGAEEWTEVTKPSYYDNFSITIADGDEVKVEVDYPDKDLKVSFVGGGDQTFDPETFSFVDIDGVRYRSSRVTDPGSTVKFGSKMELYPHRKLWTLSGVTANGNYVYAWSSLSYEFVKDEDVEFAVTAAKASKTYQLTLKVDNPEALIATYDTMAWDPNLLIDLTSGEATLEVADFQVVYYRNTPNYIIKSARIVSDDPAPAEGEEDPNDLTNARDVTVKKDMVIEFQTELLPREEQLIVYTDDDSWTYNEITFHYSDDQIEKYNTITYNPQVGRNVMNYSGELDLPVYLHVLDNIRNEDYTYTKTFPFVYINGVRTECPLAEDEYTYNYAGYPGLDKFDNNSVLKIFRNEPSIYEVSFKLGEGVAVNDVITDEVTKVEDLSEPMKLLQNTTLSFALPALENERQSYVMTLNDEEVEVPADGKFNYTVDADKAFDISIYTEPEDGIRDINGEPKAANNVYNLQGILMIRNASQEQISNLPEGLYIVGDKKVIVK